MMLSLLYICVSLYTWVYVCVLNFFYLLKCSIIILPPQIKISGSAPGHLQLEEQMIVAWWLLKDFQDELLYTLHKI
jgi:hypothetical protein